SPRAAPEHQRQVTGELLSIDLATRAWGFQHQFSALPPHLTGNRGIGDRRSFPLADEAFEFRSIDVDHVLQLIRRADSSKPPRQLGPEAGRAARRECSLDSLGNVDLRAHLFWEQTEDSAVQMDLHRPLIEACNRASQIGSKRVRARASGRVLVDPDSRQYLVMVDRATETPSPQDTSQSQERRTER